ncbi:MAG: hypothetical protein ABI743_06010 [bacterium]
MTWHGWPLERMLFLFLGLAYLLMWLQTTLLHWRAAFRSKFMYGPVILSPLVALAALLYAGSGGATLGTMMVIGFALASVSGLAGTFFHFRGVALMVGGFTLRNLAMGPPPILPILYMALGILGLLIYYWPTLTAGQAVAA